jgi:diguanylate cyclase (GGDEF)-like protein/PAS domain S-box-containing protein
MPPLAKQTHTEPDLRVVQAQLPEETYARLIAEHGTDAIVITGVDGLIQWANPAFTRMTGYTLEEVLGVTPGRLLQGKETDPDTVIAIRQALRDRRPVRCEILNYTKSKTPYWIELNISPVFDESGTHTHFMSVERDVTERKRLEAETKQALELEHHRRRERRLLFETSEWLFAAKSTDELLEVVATCMARMVPEAQGQLFLYSNSRDVLDLVCQWGGETHQEHMEADDCWALRKGRAYAYGVNQIDFTCSHVEPKGVRQEHPYLCLPIIAHGDTIGLLHLNFPTLALDDDAIEATRAWIDNRRELSLICAEQISLAVANVHLRNELHDQSVRDQLTGLWNRRWFNDAAHKELARARRRGRPLALISIDVDHFKRFNDHNGHDAGDTVLREVGAAMSRRFTEGVAPVRMGGEEFLVLAPDTDLDAARRMAEGLREDIAGLEIRYAGAKLPPVTISAGIAVCPGDAETQQELLRVADLALYAAKKGGRDQVVCAADRQSAQDSSD